MVDNDWAMQVASFRLGVIAELVGGTQLSRGEKTEALERQGRPELQHSRYLVAEGAMDATENLMIESEWPFAILKPRTRSTVPVLIGKLRALDIIGSHDEISRSTIHRFLAKEEMGRASPDATDRRRFEVDHRNEIWQCDVMLGQRSLDPTER